MSLEKLFHTEVNYVHIIEDSIVPNDIGEIGITPSGSETVARYGKVAVARAMANQG